MGQSQRNDTEPLLRLGPGGDYQRDVDPPRHGEGGSVALVLCIVLSAVASMIGGLVALGLYHAIGA